MSYNNLFKKSPYHARYYPAFTFTHQKGLWIGDPSRLPEDTNWPHWQSGLTYAAKLNQDYGCPVCSGPLTEYWHPELHHALISRADVVGLSAEYKKLIHHTFNCLVLHSNCHSIDRQVGWRLLSDVYGEGNIVEWYAGLPEEILRPNWEVYTKDK